MNEPESIQVVQDFYAALSRAEVGNMLALLAENVDWHYVGRREDIPFAGRWRGHQGIVRFLNSLSAAIDVEEFGPDEVLVCGEHVLSLGHKRALARATGRTFESEWAHLFTVRNGQIIRFREFCDTATVAGAFAPLPVPVGGPDEV